MHPSAVSLAVVAMSGAMLSVRIRNEEAMLKQQFGDEFDK
jgi:protein-S-isoprenylcysteine O-methyltransferase Ste14